MKTAGGQILRLFLFEPGNICHGVTESQRLKYKNSVHILSVSVPLWHDCCVDQCFILIMPEMAPLKKAISQQV